MPRILLVADDIAEISAVKRVLLRGSHQPVLATNSADAAAAVAKELPRAVIVSSTCEGGAGVTWARSLAADPKLAVPVLVLGESAQAPPGAVQLARPVDPGQLADQLRSALEAAARGPAPPPAGRGKPTAIGPGSAGGPPRGQEGVDRRAAAEALRQRAEELRRSGPTPPRPAASPPRPAAPAAPAPSWELDPPAGATGRSAVGVDLETQIDEELDRLTREVARGDAPAATSDAEPQARAGIEEGEEGARRRALQLARERRARTPPPPAAEQAPLPPLVPPPPPEPPAPLPPELPPPPPELSHGTLAEAPAPRLLALAERARLTGRLDFGGDAPRSLYFEEGRVVGATSGAPHERVEEVALRLGLVTRDQHRQVASALAGLSTRRAAVALLDRGFLKPAELTQLVRRRTEEVLFALFAEERAVFRYEPVPVPPDERTALDRGPLQLAMEGVRRKWLEPRLDAVLGGPATLLSPVSGGAALDRLGLGAAERRVLELADGLRTLDEILDSSPLDPLETRQLLAGLLMLGALTLRFHGSVEARRGAQSIDLARVREKLDQVRRADYYAILGLSRHATPFEVREAAGRLTAEFDPGRYAAYREPGLRGQLDEILRVIAEAREILSHDELRAEYLAGLGEEIL